MGKLLRTIFLVDLLKGLWLTLKYTPQPAFTFQYPAERRPVAPRFRGVLRRASGSVPGVDPFLDPKHQLSLVQPDRLCGGAGV